MSIEFKLPSIGEGVSSADVAEILVSPGDTISADQVVMELETEKAVVELRCPHAGKLESLLVKTGDTITVGQALMKIAGVDSGSGAAEKSAKAKPVAESSKASPAKATQASAPVATAAAPKKSASIRAGRTVDFPLPSIGEGVNQADVAEVLVKTGDVIAADQIVAELETEKAVVELRCPHAGKVSAVHIKAGDTMAVGAKVLTIESTSDAAVEEQAAAPNSPPAPSKAEAGSSKSASPAKSTATAVKAAAQEIIVAPPGENGNGTGRAPAPAAPSTRRLARELGVDLHEIRGTGPGGRITQEDVQGYVRNRLKGISVPASRAASSGMPVLGSIAPPPLPDFGRFGVIERQAMSKIARVTAENLTVSWTVIPHVTQHDRADITDLEQARKRFVEGLGKKGPKVTMTAIVIKALSTCLQAFPKFNSSLDPLTNEIVIKRYYNIGCAVDTEYGLVVPVVKDCHQKSIIQIASDVNELAEKARDKKLSIDSMQGATCTVTNLGGIGGVGFTPIVNYPEVCILGMSRSQSELRLRDGKVEERMMLPLSLSYDHRVINGADAARFLVAMCNMLSDPFQLLTTI
jgi:pyruvate dehydrogenase E2 component (dihydrolipoamide acetyltransferase)